MTESFGKFLSDAQISRAENLTSDENVHLYDQPFRQDKVLSRRTSSESTFIRLYLAIEAERERRSF